MKLADYQHMENVVMGDVQRIVDRETLTTAEKLAQLEHLQDHLANFGGKIIMIRLKLKEELVAEQHRDKASESAPEDEKL